jgi:hypothetical protein
VGRTKRNSRCSTLVIAASVFGEVGRDAACPCCVLYRVPDQSASATPTPGDQLLLGCAYEGEWIEAVARSLLTLKTLTYGPTCSTSRPMNVRPRREQTGGTCCGWFRFVAACLMGFRVPLAARSEPKQAARSCCEPRSRVRAFVRALRLPVPSSSIKPPANWPNGDGPGRDRTCDLGIKSPLLYQLSYRPAV